MKQAFSLVELSIVLVILGLLTGGILTGQSLIRAAELRSVTTEYQRYQSAVNTFRDKYFALPGDMRNATAFWGTATVGTCPVASGMGTQTCNGDGDGILANYTDGTEHAEAFHFWKQLANAGLIEGTYSGVSGSGGGRHVVIGDNAPRSKLSNAGWSVGFHPVFTSHADRHLGESGVNQLSFGGQTSGFELIEAALAPEEAWNVDTKLDDGLPATGGLLTFKGAGTQSPNCANSTDTQYNLNMNAILCPLTFVSPF